MKPSFRSHALQRMTEGGLVSRAYGPDDIDTDRIGHNALAKLIGCSRQALTDRRKRGTVPEPDGQDEKGLPYWKYKTICHLVNRK
nr:hypothetical protein [Brevibacillus laterosporus]